MGLSFSDEISHWEDEAASDAFWAVLSVPQGKNGKWDPKEFFATGERRIHSLMTRLEKYDRRSWKKVLDFGCGVGRLSRALASRSEEVIGIDASETMIRLSRQLNSDVENVSFMLNQNADLSVFERPQFDLIFTELVLQHVSDRQRIKAYIKEFVRILNPGGILVFQLPSQINWIYRFRLRRKLFFFLRNFGFSESFLRQKLNLTTMLMNFIPCDEMIAFLNSLPVQLLEHKEVPEGGIRSTTYYLKRNE